MTFAGKDIAQKPKSEMRPTKLTKNWGKERGSLKRMCGSKAFFAVRAAESSIHFCFS